MTADAHYDKQYNDDKGPFRHEAPRPNGFRSFLSAAWIIGLPATFWIAVFEFLNYVLFLELSAATRLVTAGVLVGLFAIVWALVSAAARQGVPQTPS